jgi:hypothetical protein
MAGAYEMRVFIDNQERMRLGAGETKTAIVPAGRHSIYAKLPWFFWPSNRSRVLTIDAVSNRTVFMTNENSSSATLALVQYMDVPFDSLPDKETPQNPAIPSSGQNLPKIAVYVTGDVPNNEKEALGTRMLASLVNSGRYMGIERSNSLLAEIEKEHIKQRSGAIDDNQISALGKQFGVKFVCIAAITPAFGDFQVSARIVDVETAQVIFIGESASMLKSMADLARVSDQVVKNMFGEPMATARQQAFGQETKYTADFDTEYTLSPTAHYTYYKFWEREWTALLNIPLPGVGSLVIMQDGWGAVTQLVLGGSGIALMFNGFDTHEETMDDYYYNDGGYTYTYAEPNALFWTGAAMYLSSMIYNCVRSVTYVKKPANTASLETTGLQWAVLPDQNGEVKAYLAYRVEF